MTNKEAIVILKGIQRDIMPKDELSGQRTEDVAFDLAIKALEAQKEERPTGEWIRTALYGQTCYECDNCKLHYDCISNYCPNCGSKMKGAEE